MADEEKDSAQPPPLAAEPTGPSSRRLPVASLEQLREDLKHMEPPPPASEVTAAAAIRGLRVELQAIMASGYTVPMLAKMLEGKGIQITGKTLENYLYGLGSSRGGKKAARRHRGGEHVGVRTHAAKETENRDERTSRNAPERAGTPENAPERAGTPENEPERAAQPVTERPPSLNRTTLTSRRRATFNAHRAEIGHLLDAGWMIAAIHKELQPKLDGLTYRVFCKYIHRFPGRGSPTNVEAGPRREIQPIRSANGAVVPTGPAQQAGNEARTATTDPPARTPGEGPSLTVFDYNPKPFKLCKDDDATFDAKYLFPKRS